MGRATPCVIVHYILYDNYKERSEVSPPGILESLRSPFQVTF